MARSSPDPGHLGCSRSQLTLERGGAAEGEGPHSAALPTEAPPAPRMDHGEPCAPSCIFPGGAALHLHSRHWGVPSTATAHRGSLSVM